MLADAKCQLLYRSDDLSTWEPAGTVLDAPSGVGSGRTDDLGPGLHAQVVVAGDVGWTFYFTHPDRHRPDARAGDMRRSTIQVAALVPDGDRLRCVRDATVAVDTTGRTIEDIYSPSAADYWRRELDKVVDGRRPAVGLHNLAWRGASHLSILWLRMHLASNGADVDMILGYDALIGRPGEAALSGIRAA